MACAALGNKGESIVYLASVFAIADVTKDVPAVKLKTAVGEPMQIFGRAAEAQAVETGLTTDEYCAQKFAMGQFAELHLMAGSTSAVG